MAKGRNKRDAIIAYLGGKCKICGYSRNNGALSFHHVNPETKSFDLGVKNCKSHNFEELKAEAKKCVLLCNNCHAEIHYPNLTVKESLFKRIVRMILSRL